MNYTRVIVADYMHHRLRRNGMQWPNSCPVDLPTSPGRVERAMRSLGEEFEERYQQVFNEMCQQLHITPNNAEATFATIVGELFSDGIKWGRIVALFSFGGCLAVECVQKEMPNLVDQVLEWTTRYVDLNLMPWIQQNGGWDGFIEFSNGVSDERNESPWPSLKTLCGYAVGAIGVLTLGAILSQKS